MPSFGLGYVWTSLSTALKTYFYVKTATKVATVLVVGAAIFTPAVAPISLATLGTLVVAHPVATGATLLLL
jgi:hypothetical protein